MPIMDNFTPFFSLLAALVMDCACLLTGKGNIISFRRNDQPEMILEIWLCMC